MDDGASGELHLIVINKSFSEDMDISFNITSAEFFEPEPSANASQRVLY